MGYFDSFNDFIHMGGHGFYVWLCYAIVFIGMVSQFVLAKLSAKKNIKLLSQYYRRAAARKKSQANNDS